MINLERLHTKENSELEVLAREEDRQKKQITRKMDAQIKRVSAHAESKREVVRENYARIGSAEVLSQLIEDYQVLQDRENTPADISDEELERAKYIAKLRMHAEGMKKELGENSHQCQFFNTEAEAMQKLFNVSEEAIAVAQGKKIGFEPCAINSYIGFDKGIVYLVTPTGENETKPIAQSLETKIFDIIGSGAVSLGVPKKYDHRMHDVIGDETSIFYTPEKTLANGFVIYTMNLEKDVNNTSGEMAAQMKQKLEQLQPEAFKDVKLEHKVHEVNARLVRYLMSHSKEEILHSKDALGILQESGQYTISYKEAADIVNKDVRTLKNLVRNGIVQADESDNIVISSLTDYLSKPRRTSHSNTPSYNVNEYKANSPESVKEEALHRLAEVSENGRIEKLDGRKAAYVFGMKPESSWSLARRPGLGHCFTREDGTDKYIYDTKMLKSFIGSSTPRKHGKGFTWSNQN